MPRALIITGSGNKAFSAGFDVNPENPQVANFVKALQEHDKTPVEGLIRRIRTSVDALVTLPVPVIAAINRIAYGGGAEIAVRCDMRVMDPDAVISLSEVTLGLMPDHGGVVGLTRLIGASKALDLILTGRKVRAKEAFEMGLVNRISFPEKALEDAQELAGSIAENSPKAVRHALKVIRAANDLTNKDALDLESIEAVDLITSGECIEGITAFLSKQKPKFYD